MKKWSANKYLINTIILLPTIFFYIVLFYGLLMSVLRSLGHYESIGLKTFTIEYLVKVITNETILYSVANTFIVSFVEAATSVVIAIIISIYLIKKRINNPAILYMPVSIPHIVVGMMMILLFAQNGFFSRFAYHLHLIDKPTQFFSIINDKYNLGIIIAYIYKGIAYTLSVTYVIMKRHNDKYYEVAKTMNINFMKYVKDILLPNSYDAIVSCFLILFSYSFGAYELPFLLGNTKSKLLPVLAYERYLSSNFEDKPIFFAINLVMVLVGIVILLIYKKVLDNLANEKKYI